MKILNGYFRVMDVIYKVVEALALTLLAATMTLLFVQTILRYCFHYSLVWAEELCRYMCIWMAFLGSGIGIRDDIHVGFDLLKNRLPHHTKDILVVVLNALVFGGSFILIRDGAKLMKQVHTQISASLGFSMSYVYASLVVGAVLIALFSIEYIVKKVVKK